jgi:hypothetical protein
MSPMTQYGLDVPDGYPTDSSNEEIKRVVHQCAQVVLSAEINPNLNAATSWVIQSGLLELQHRTAEQSRQDAASASEKSLVVQRRLAHGTLIASLIGIAASIGVAVWVGISTDARAAEWQSNQTALLQEFNEGQESIRVQLQENSTRDSARISHLDTTVASIGLQLTQFTKD